MEAEHIPGRMEEKATPYRQHRPSSEDIDLDDNAQSESNSASSSSDGSAKVTEQHKEIKRVFKEIMDAQGTIKLHKIIFTWSEPGDVHFITNPDK